jgi:hypothetical protein
MRSGRGTGSPDWHTPGEGGDLVVAEVVSVCAWCEPIQRRRPSGDQRNPEWIVARAQVRRRPRHMSVPRRRASTEFA